MQICVGRMLEESGIFIAVRLQPFFTCRLIASVRIAFGHPRSWLRASTVCAECCQWTERASKRGDERTSTGYATVCLHAVFYLQSLTTNTTGPPISIGLRSGIPPSIGFAKR
jgi:hypothetical protein